MAPNPPSKLPTKDDKTATTTATAPTTGNAAAADTKKKELEEDDEFEDFPVEGLFILFFSYPRHTMNYWQEEVTQLPGGNAHLWEESWDDDDADDEFAVQLREELKKLGPK
ncbi:hypothetical protein M011DRAFT_487184 [Sporormia fimetaria CBS 119925]|uniref:26S proteasome complex subunit SEM1 n=1 Tax=Sporormia fimetaria CBS 119925 TaxID=1340428 RepID=A0A6A6V711_9PLEO|nr:hypothetical protein M011DRAFT_487184 [Sporormia fimetaria CBS 119925]